MNILGLGRIFNMFRRNAREIQLGSEPVDPKVQAYLNLLRDHGPEAAYGSNMIGLDELNPPLRLAA